MGGTFTFTLALSRAFNHVPLRHTTHTNSPTYNTHYIHAQQHRPFKTYHKHCRELDAPLVKNDSQESASCIHLVLTAPAPASTRVHTAQPTTQHRLRLLILLLGQHKVVSFAAPQMTSLSTSSAALRAGEDRTGLPRGSNARTSPACGFGSFLGKARP